MNANPTSRKANTKTAAAAPATTKTSRITQLKKSATAAAPVAPAPSPKRRPAKVNSQIAQPALVAPAGTSKQARLITMLRALPGATIEQMMTLTGWQAHTVRGTISGVLRKKLGLNVTCEVRDGSGRSLYRIIGASVSA